MEVTISLGRSVNLRKAKKKYLDGVKEKIKRHNRLLSLRMYISILSRSMNLREAFVFFGKIYQLKTNFFLQENILGLS